MPPKSSQCLYHFCLLSFTPIIFSLTPKLLSAQEIEPEKNWVSSTLLESSPRKEEGERGRGGEGENSLPPLFTRPKGLKSLSSDTHEKVNLSRNAQGDSRIRDPKPPVLSVGSSRLKSLLPETSQTEVTLTPPSPSFRVVDEQIKQMSAVFLPSSSLIEESGVRAKRNVVEPRKPVSVAQVPPEVKPPSLEPPPPLEPLPTLPPPDQLLSPPTQQPTQPESTPQEAPATLCVKRFEFEGNTVYSNEKLVEVTKPYTQKCPISFAELLQARSAITQLYVKEGYTTSGAIIPPQKILNPEAAVVKIRVVEGTLERINVTGTRRLRPGYVSSRLALAATKPLNIKRLLQRLQLLQLDPAIKNLSADLQAGTRPGTNILQVKVTEANLFSPNLILDNSRSPFVGSFRRRIVLNAPNLLGFGDGLSLGYTNTDGSNAGDISYTLPVNPHNGKVSLAFGVTDSNVIEPPFDRLDISAKSRYYELTFRQPFIQTPTEELDLGLTFSHQRSQTFLGIDDIGPYPLVPGADERGRTSVSALRFFQQLTKRSNQQAIAFRSQFSVGLGILGATINNNGEPDSRFFTWQGQGQWLRQLAPDTLLVLKADMQLTNSRLLGLEQFVLGGQESVRGYRQDYLLKDNGWLASAEVRLPILRMPEVGGLLQLAPFIDVGTAWNNASAPPAPNIPNTLIGTGLGLLWRQGDNLTIRLDFGIGLVSIDSKGDTWQDNGVYFSINYKPF